MAPARRTVRGGRVRLGPAVVATLALGVLLTLGSCASGPDDGPGPTSTTAPASAVALPDTSAGRATQWVLDTLAAPAGPSAAEAEAVFAPVFLAEIPAAQVAGVFDQLRAAGPFTLVSYDEGPIGSATTARTVVNGAGGASFVLTVSTDAESLVQGLWLAPTSPPPQIDTLDDAAAAVEEAADAGSFLLARVSGEGADARCVQVAAAEPDVLRPIGSIVKLYVLGAVVDAVADGRLAWTDTLTLTDELRSLPSGRLQDEPAGTQVSVRQAAEAMIAISDNTATDLLIDAVGRDAVESAVARMGHSDPEVLAPFLTTREMFVLAFASPALRRAWTDVTGDDPLSPDPRASERQRQLLTDVAEREPALDESLLASPAWPLGLDWFATAEDVCRAHLALQDLARTPAGEPVRAILSANPGLTSADRYEHVAFKGGSAPGEIAGSWYVESGDERVVVVVTAASVDGAAPDGGWLVAVADQALEAHLG